MKNLTISNFIAAVLAIACAYALVSYFEHPANVSASGDGATARTCIPTVITSKPVGNQLSSLILATSSLRAWARIGITGGATSTVYLNFNDAPAAVGSSMALNVANVNGASSTPSVDFGRNTDFVYTGAVRAITNTGSTTILVTECNYLP